MTVTYRAGESSVSVRPSGTLQYSDGGFYQNCFDSSTGKAATPTTLARPNIPAATGTGAQGQTTILDESAATFADFNRFTDIAITTGTNR